MPIKSQFWAYLENTYPNPCHKQFLVGKKKSNSIGTALPKRSRTQSCTHHFGELELEERKEKRSWSPKTEWSWAMLEAPSYLSQACDVTYANRADQMTRWNIFNFLRAHGEESSRSRPLEGDRDIFRSRNNCVKTQCLMCQTAFKLISIKNKCFHWLQI